ncbi:MAG: ABC transporter permease [Bryobacteraceae bacterium]|nr:ABC transporter permease [Bryobacteraceae bacterium]
MSLWTRVGNVFQGRKLNREIDEELQSHFEEALAEGRDPAEARRAFGPLERLREESRDAKLIPWLDSLRADAIFGWRQIMKRKVTSGAAIFSLALGIGACTSAFRLIDAVLLRPLPIASPERLYDVYRDELRFDGKPGTFDGWAYPVFQQMRAAVKEQAELIAVSYAQRTDLTYRSDQEMERAYLQYVSGWMFDSFGLRPALGRLFSESDDMHPGAHPYAVLSHEYWTRRFGQDPKVLGRTFRLGDRLYEIVGVCEQRFTGTEPGTMVDVFVPTMMNRSVVRRDSTWHRTLAMLQPGAAIEPLRQRLNAISMAFEQERAKGFTNMAPQAIALYLHKTVRLEPASSGVSGMQSDNRRALTALGVMVGLVLLIACANVANLMTAQAAARSREIALRVSIGAGRWRLVQLVLMESALLAFLAAGLGGVFAWWSGPLVANMINPADNPARLSMPADWRVLGFGLALTLAVTILFGLTPALRASAVKPVSALKGGEDPHSRRRMMNALIATQVVFCFLVLYIAGLFAATFDRLSSQPNGFSAERILNLETTARNPQPPVFWEQAAEHLRSVPGVEKVALAGWPLLGGNAWNNSVSINGGPPSEDLTYLMNVSPGWIGTMKIRLMNGSDFSAFHTYPGAAIVNDTFVERYFKGENPVGRWFDETGDEGERTHLQIVGVVRDVRYLGIRQPIPPVAYVPFHSVDKTGAGTPIGRGTFVVRTSTSNPLALASILRRAVPGAQPEFRVSNIRTQEEINASLTVRERLMAALALFFAAVALLLAGVGLYGVLDYSVLQRRREIGIRMAIGAPSSDIARRVTVSALLMVLLGAFLGLALGLASARSLETLLFQVKATDADVLVFPSLTLLAVALLAALPAVIRAVRIDPARTLRAD